MHGSPYLLKLSRLVTLAACAASFLCVPAVAGAVTDPAGFEEQQVVGGLTRPANVAWAPDGRTFVVEKDGLLKVVAPGGSTASLVLEVAEGAASPGHPSRAGATARAG